MVHLDKDTERIMGEAVLTTIRHWLSVLMRQPTK